MASNITNDPPYTQTAVNTSKAGAPVAPILTPVEDTSLQLDSYASPAFDPNLLTQIEVSKGYNYLDAPSTLDVLQIELLDQYGKSTTSIVEHISNIPGIAYIGGRLQVDTFSILTQMFSKTSGKYSIRIRGYRNYIYNDLDNEVNSTIELTPEDVGPGAITFAGLEVVEFSRSRTEVRVKSANSSYNSFSDFYESQSPKTIPVRGRYWKYPNSPTIYFSPSGVYSVIASIQFTTMEDYDAHRSSLDLPFGNDSEQRFDGVRMVDPTNYTQIGWRNNTSTGGRLESTKDIWPVQLRALKSDGQPIDLISINWMHHEYTPRQVEGEAVVDSFDTIIFKLASPAPKTLRARSILQVQRPLFVPYTIPLEIDIPIILNQVITKLRGPNLRLDVTKNASKGTTIKNETDLIGTVDGIKTRLEKQILTDDGLIRTNIDYRQFKNFVHFSSAEERVRNFNYKLSRIEHYSSKSSAVATGFAGTDSSVTGSATLLANKVQYDKLHNGIINSFNPYEQYLYYTSHSTETIYSSDGVETLPPATWPKSTSTKTGIGYNLYSVTSSQGEAWYNNQIISASLWDQQNQSALRNVIPTFIRVDPEQSSYQLFFDMVGEHFDEVYLHIKGLEESYNRDESINVGLSKDLLFDVAKSFGWDLYPGHSTADLWEYALGTDSTGTYQASSSGETLTHVVKESHSSEDIEKQTWKRLLNNLPLLLKTKGTARGIRALLSAYGIPLTILNIDEYGGAPASRADDKRAIEKFSYALDMDGANDYAATHHHYFKQGANSSTVNSLTTPGTSNRALSMYEVRVDTGEQRNQYIARSLNHPGLGPKWEVRMEHSSSAIGWDTAAAITAGSASAYAQYGRFVFEISASDGQPAISSSTAYLPIYDNDWWNVSFGVTEHPYTGVTTAPKSQSFVIRCAKASEHGGGKITHQSSGTVMGNSESYSLVWSADDFALWGTHLAADGTPGFLSYSGSMQEIRGWAEYLSDNAFHQHTLAPTSVVGNTVEMAYNDLLLRHPLGTDGKTYNHVTTTAVTSSIPNTHNLTWTHGGIGKDISFSGFSDNVPYSPKSETYYVKVPHTAGPSKHSNKVRIEDNTLRNNQLARDVSFEVSSFDSNPIDSEDVSVVLSPADQIDTDIAMQFGGFDLDDYIGDPRDAYKQEYTSLRNTKNLYFKKYSEGNSVMAFISYLRSFNKGLFKQIEDMIPARADAIVGIEIRPNLLERHKLNQPLSASQETTFYTSSISIRTSFICTGSDIPSTQEFNSSNYGTLTTTMGIGAAPSRQRSGSNDHYNLYEGSTYLRDVFGEATESGLQTYVSSSAIWSRGEDFKFVPTYNIYHRPRVHEVPTSITGVTGSAGRINGSSLYPKSIDILPNYISSPAQRRLLIDGTKITSPDWNVGSTQTIDGGPVAEYQLVNPNIIQVAPTPFNPTNQGRSTTSPVGSGPNNPQQVQNANINVR